MPNWLTIVVYSVFSYISIFIIAKMLGKKQVAQLTVVDYVVGITIGNIAGQWCTDYENPWYHYIIGMVVFLFLTLLINFLERKIPFKRLLKGKQIELVTNGKINYANLKKSKLDVNDLLGLCRAKSYFDLEEISYVYLENNGDISVLPKDRYRQTILEDIKTEFEPKTEPAIYLIIDGNVNKSALAVLNKDTAWLFNCCEIKSKHDLKNVILAEHIEGDQVKIHYKN